MRILVAASGSGGHLFPALHIINALRKLDPQGEVQFIGAGRPLEAKILDPHDIPRHTIRTAGIKNRGVRGILEFLSTGPRAVLELVQLYRKFKPEVVVGVGGYASVLPVLLAWVYHIPTWIHEAELRPGLANWFLAHTATVISTAFAEAQMPCPKKVRYTGHPVRGGLAQIRRTAPRSRPHKILITGGSQGARALDAAMTTIAAKLKPKNLEYRHQCRPDQLASVTAGYQASGVAAQVVPFIEDMIAAYDWADVVISRSGASAIMELGVVNIPCILVPYPHAQGDHQTKNAAVLVNAGKARLVPEGPEFEARLEQEILGLLEVDVQQGMIDAPYESRSVTAAERIGEGVLGLKGK